MLLICLVLVLLFVGSDCACSGRFCSGGVFVPYNFYNIIEGYIPYYHVGFFRAVSYSSFSPRDSYIASQCDIYGQLAMNSISIVQVGNSWDPYLQDNSFSLNYSSLTLQTNYNYGYISVLTNTYEGCLITLLWNKVYSASYTAQLDRATYTIKKHLNAMNEPTTEFQTVNRYIYNYTASSYATIQNTYRPSCGFTKYMWMPSKKLFFFMDYTSNNWYLVFTCFPYNTAPSKACDADFDQSGTPTFKIITLNTYTGYGSYLNLVNTMTFTRGYGYTAWQYYWLTSYYDYYYGYSTVTHWQWHIFRHVFSGSSCSDYGVSRDSDVYDGEDSSAYSLSSVLVVPNVGIAFIKSNAAGIYTVPLDNSTGLNALGSYSAVVLRSDCTWKLYQQSIDSTEDPPLFGISSCDKFSIYRITTVATLIYTNSTLNFYDYTCDVGRAHFIVVHPGTCSQLLAAANYEYAHVTYVNLETLQADFCNMDKPRTTTTSAVDSSACGNGVIDYGEECDDGNKRSGDGCNSTCLIEAGWRCSSSPYQIISQCVRNECGDGYVNSAAPVFEACDDGNTMGADGCSANCTVIEPGYYCGVPNQPCVKVCPNGQLDYYPGMPHYLYEYNETCDDGNAVSGDGCTKDCFAIEAGYECPVVGQLCRKICTNGILNTGEDCDDGNTINGDGCSTSCKIESGWKCYPPTYSVCYKACGDNVLDTNSPFNEECDDGNNINGDGCSSTCTKETLARIHSYTTYTYAINQELLVTTPTAHNNIQDCMSPYLTAETATTINGLPAAYVCYTGRHCYRCTGPRFPGYPLMKKPFLPHSTYNVLPTINRGRLRTIVYGGEVAFSLVVNDHTLIKNNGTDLNISHNATPNTRQSFGRYYLQNSGNNAIQLYTLSNDSSLSCKMQYIYTSTKIMPPQLGNDFYIWWPGVNLLMSRQYNGRNMEFYAFHNRTLESISNPSTFSYDLLFDGVIIPPLEILGEIILDPVAHGGNLYVPLYVEDLAVPPTKTYQVSSYKSNLPWYITHASTMNVTARIISIVSFSGAVIVSRNTTDNFMNIDTGTVPGLDYTGGVPTCDTTAFPNWVLMQSRPSPDFPEESPPVYAFCSNYTMYLANYYANNDTIVLNTTDPISLPDDKPESRHMTGRYNLGYPYDINGKYLVNLAIHPCTKYVLYRWDEWNFISASIFDLENRTTRCVDVPLYDATFG